ncbi:MAG: phosphate ABC transporter substrate-binding protein PstS, partial [Sorangiineae bacterium NIC37A_2]
MNATKTVLAAATAAMLFGIGSAEAQSVTGAGSTFIYPALSQWADAYKKDTGVEVNYQAIGSGGGLQQLAAKTVTFAASD